MNLRQFARAQARIALATARLIARVLRPFLIPELNLRDWVDVLATIYDHLGIDTARHYLIESGRPIRLLPHGQPIRELFV